MPNSKWFILRRNSWCYSRCGQRVEAWPQPLTSVVCHEMLFWCHSQPLWPLLHQHNTSSTPQPSVQLIQPASTCIPTIHFPWRLSFSTLSCSLSFTPSFAFAFFHSVSLILSFLVIQWFRKVRRTKWHRRSHQGSGIKEGRQQIIRNTDALNKPCLL